MEILPVVPDVAVGCESDDDCPDYTACRNRKCINPCAEDKPCAPSAICKVVSHNAVCTCPNGFIGNPQTRCSPRKLQIYSSYLDYYLFTFNLWMFHFMFHNALWLHDSKFSAPQPECLVDPDCPSRLACINEKCENPCFTLSCGIRADCKVKNHRAICVCRPGLIGNPHEICEERKQMMINIEGFLLNFLFNSQTLSFDSWLQVWRWVPN